MPRPKPEVAPAVSVSVKDEPADDAGGKPDTVHTRAPVAGDTVMESAAHAARPAVVLSSVSDATRSPNAARMLRRRAVAGSVAASAIDGVGGIPFLRAVRHHERQKMAAVYRTYIDCSALIPAFVFAIALLWLPIGAVFVILSGALAAVGYVAWRYLPKSL